MFQFLSRQPFAIVGAIGLVGVFKGFLTLQEDILQIIDAYETVTFYIWDFLFGWVDIYLFAVPNWVKQFLILSIIHAMALLRVSIVHEDVVVLPENRQSSIFAFVRDSIFNILELILMWPIMYVLMPYCLFRDRKLRSAIYDPIYYSHLIKDMSIREKHKFDDNLRECKNLESSAYIFSEFLCWALALILLSYGLFFFKG